MPIHVQAGGGLRGGVPAPRRPLQLRTSPRPTSTTSSRRTPSATCSAHTGTFEGKRVSVQGTTWSCGATIVFEELVQLGVKKLLRVGVRRSPGPPQARRHDRRDQRRPSRARPRSPRRQRAALPDRELGAGARRRARREEIGQEMHVGPIVSNDLFYNPDEGQYELVEARRPRGRDGGGGALHRRRAPRRPGRSCLLIVSDIIVEGEFKQADEEMRSAVDRMTRGPRRPARPAISDTVFLVNPGLGERVDERRWAEMARRRDEGGSRATRCSPSGRASWAARRGCRGRRRKLSSSSAATAR